MEDEKKSIDYRWIIIITLLIAGTAMYFYHSYQINHTRKNLSIQADSALRKQANSMLKMTAKPLIWAIRAEMLRNNLDEINVFNTDLVREKNITKVTLMNADGKIINSTDKKIEGSIAKIAGYDKYLQTDSVQIFGLNDSTFRLAAPIMGYQSKLGVVVLDYGISKFEPQ